MPPSASPQLIPSLAPSPALSLPVPSPASPAPSATKAPSNTSNVPPSSLTKVSAGTSSSSSSLASAVPPNKPPPSKTWRLCDKQGIVLCTFTASGEHQISLTVGDVVTVTEEFVPGQRKNSGASAGAGSGGGSSTSGGSLGWYRGIVQRTGRNGIFPASYIDVSNRPTNALTAELTAVLREWYAMLKTYYRDRKLTEYAVMRERLYILIEKYRKIMAPSLDPTTRDNMRREMIRMVEQGRKLLGLDTIVRTASGDPADEFNTPIIPLYHLHMEAARDLRCVAQSSDSIQARRKRGDTLNWRSDDGDWTINNSKFMEWKTRTEEGLTYGDRASAVGAHLFVPQVCLLMDMKILMCSVGEDSELFFSLYHYSALESGNSGQGQTISEEFVVELTAQGMPHDISKIGNIRTLFADIPVGMLPDLYVVVRVLRKGKMKFDAASTGSAAAAQAAASSYGAKKGTSYRRPFAVAVQGLPHPNDPSFVYNKEMEYTIPIYASSQESNFSSLHEIILKGGSVQEVPRAKGVCVGVTYLPGDVAYVMSAAPDLKQYPITNRMSFPEVMVPGISRNDLYVTLESGDFLQDRKRNSKNIEACIKLRLDTGEQLSECLLAGSGKAWSNELRSFVVYHTNSPRWHETFMIRLVPSLFARAHLYVTFRHCSTKDGKDKPWFAFAFLPIATVEGTAVENRTYALHTFKLEKGQGTDVDPSLYLPLRNVSDAPASSKLSMRKGEVIKMRTSLLSTVVPHNATLLGLLMWQKHKEPDLAEILRKSVYLELQDITRFARDTFDSLFQILESRREGLTLLVFDALLHYISLYIDDKRSVVKNKEIVEMYIREYFTSPMAHQHLVACVKYYLQQSTPQPGASGVHSAGPQIKSITTLKCLEFLFKFITRSRALYVQQHGHNDGVYSDDDFKSSLGEVFEAMNSLMSLKGKAFVTGQAVAIRNFALIVPDLRGIFTIEELSTLLAKYIDAIQYKGELRILNMQKLSLIYSLMTSPLYRDDKAIAILNPSIIKQLKLHLTGIVQVWSSEAEKARLIAAAHSGLTPHLSPVSSPTMSSSPSMSHIGPGDDGDTKDVVNEEELVQCVFILYVVIDTLQERDLVTSDLYGLVPVIYYALSSSNPRNIQQASKTYAKTSSDRPAFQIPVPGDWQLSMVTILLGIYHLMGQGHLASYLTSLKQPNHRREFLHNTFEILLSMTHPTALGERSVLYPPLNFPENWRAVSLFQGKTVLKVMQMAVPLMLTGVTEPGQAQPTALVLASDAKLWGTVLLVHLQFLKSRVLAVELHPPSKRGQILSRYGDMRLPVVGLLTSIWTTLQSLQLALLPTLIGPVIELMLVGEERVRTVGLDMYFDLMRREFNNTKSFYTLEMHTLNAIDRLTLDREDETPLLRRVDEAFQRFFEGGLESKLAVDPDPTIRTKGAAFLKDIARLIALMLALRNQPQGPAYEDDRTYHMMRLMSYLRQTERIPAFIKYIHQLATLHEHSKNYTEAALTLLLHGSLLRWSNQTQPAMDHPPHYPEETEAERKERLYTKAMEHMHAARQWERAIVLMAALRIHYENTSFDYDKLALVLSKEAACFRAIVNADRYYNEYFRVAYYGRGFDALQGKEYVYRCSELERLQEFVSRIKNKFPAANLLQYNHMPPPEVINGEGQYIQIYSVKPCPPIAAFSTVAPSQSIASSFSLPSGQRGTGSTEEGDIYASDFVPPSSKMPVVIQKYHLQNNVNTFSFTLPPSQQPQGSPKDMDMLAVTYYITEDVFPTIHKRSQVVARHEEQVHPIDHAIAIMSAKNQEVSELVERFQQVPPTQAGSVNLSPLTVVLKGYVDSSVTVNLVTYRDTFFAPDFLRKFPTKDFQVAQLLALVNFHLDQLEAGVETLRVLAPPGMESLVAQLENQIEDVKIKIRR
eukprot:TRINITY_DN869_c0_g1_i1.p1 TRINITY_DN869_c0_g1~~TRINITY_DN869_c0_g1_i1.p1  ORF type:complete len:2087 (-),score=649.48 TRINITY_DN869_c0_g1_i1:81-5777(-)